MKIPITRSIKITLLKWLQNGCIETTDIDELNDDDSNRLPDFIIEKLTPEQRAVLLTIGQELLKEEFP